jgi:peptide/nickel transport system substrate-binding protein
MTRTRLSGAKAIAATAMVGSVALCGVGGSTSAFAAGQSSVKPTLTFAVDAAVTTGLSPAQTGITPWTIDDLAYLPLIQLDPQGNYVPGLAKSWGFSDDNKTLEMQIRGGVRFSDGSLLTAQGVADWLKFDVAHKGLDASELNLASVDVTAPSTVVMHLTTPTPDMLYLLSEDVGPGMVVSPEAMQDPSELNNVTDGTGPYTIVPSASVANSVYTFVPNKYYYEPAQVHWGKVVVDVITNVDSTLEALRTGEIELAEGDITTAAAAKAAGLQVIAKPWGWEGVVFLDRGAKAPDGSPQNPLSSVLVRQALNYAVNREAIAQALFGKYGTPTSEIPTQDGWVPADKNYYPYDPAKAKKLLAEAGYPHGFTINVLDQNYTGTDPMLEAVAENESAIGVKFNLTPGPQPAEWLSDWFSGKFSASGIIYTIFFTSDTLYPGYFAPNGWGNQHGWNDPVLDRYANEAAILPPTEAVPYWQKMWNRTVTQADEMPVVEVNGFYYTNNKVAGVEFSGKGGTADPIYWYPR